MLNMHPMRWLRRMHRVRPVRLVRPMRPIHWVAMGLTLAASALAAPAKAQDEEKDGLRRPERLTVGVADQFLGQLSPDRKSLYFSSNRNTTNEIYSQNTEDGRAHLLFDEGAEVAWPRVSPDGKSILYVSYSERATGQLCVRDLPSADHRRCLETGANETSAALLAEWIDATHVVLVARASIDGNLRAFRVVAGRKLESRLLFERNITSPAVSPDGRWLVYVPVERASERVGPAFAAHAAERLEAVRLDAVEQAGGEAGTKETKGTAGTTGSPGSPNSPVQITKDVPGLTGQPAFGKDGRSLYFVQFFSDSNHDGVVDASDHGVLFRMPLSFGKDGLQNPVSGPAMQLSDEAWNCQYPAPAADRLLATCSRGRNLDLYSLPLDGEVPGDWTTDRLGSEAELATSHAKLQLLYHARLARSTTPAARRFIMVRLVRLHLALEEFDAAEFYAKRIATLDDPESAALASPLRVLIDHRKAVRERERGRILESFDERAEARMKTLGVPSDDATPAGVLTRVVRSEIADSIGDKALARRELEAAAVDKKVARAVLEAYYERADALYRELDDREALVTACRRLATNETLPEDDRLRYARAAVRAMVRGLPFAEAEARLVRERASAPANSEVAFALDLGRAVMAIRSERPGKETKAALIAMYDAEKRDDRRRAIVIDALERASAMGADGIIEGISERYVDGSNASAQERRRAERLYTRSLVGRAFRRRAAEKFDEARADFEAVAKRTGSLEAIVGAIDLRLRAGETADTIRAEYATHKGERATVEANFVKAYLLSRSLRKLEGDAHEAAAKEAISALTASWADLKKQCMAQALYGAILHAEYLRTNELVSAERANTHYLVALELVSDNLRYKAMILGELGLLHDHVGNYRIALGYLNDRDKLPYAENSEGFAVRLAKARALLHIGQSKEAAAAADEALAMLDKAPKLAGYRVLALDRAALCNLAADRFERALSLYDEEIGMLAQTPGPEAGRNRFVTRLAHAAAALGAKQPARALADLDEVDRALSTPSVAASLSWAHATNEQVIHTYQLIAAGLRARAAEDLGKADVAARSLEARRTLLEAGLKATDRPEYVRMLALVDTQLAQNAFQRHDAVGAAKATTRALAHADNLRERAKGELDKGQLDVLWLAAQANASARGAATAEIGKHLALTQDALLAQGAPAFRDYARWFEVFLTLTGPLEKDVADAPKATTK